MYIYYNIKNVLLGFFFSPWDLKNPRLAMLIHKEHMLYHDLTEESKFATKKKQYDTLFLAQKARVAQDLGLYPACQACASCICCYLSASNHGLMAYPNVTGIVELCLVHFSHPIDGFGM